MLSPQTTRMKIILIAHSSPWHSLTPCKSKHIHLQRMFFCASTSSPPTGMAMFQPNIQGRGLLKTRTFGSNINSPCSAFLWHTLCYSMQCSGACASNALVSNASGTCHESLAVAQNLKCTTSLCLGIWCRLFDPDLSCVKPIWTLQFLDGFAS